MTILQQVRIKDVSQQQQQQQSQPKPIRSKLTSTTSSSSNKTNNGHATSGENKCECCCSDKRFNNYLILSSLALFLVPLISILILIIEDFKDKVDSYVAVLLLEIVYIMATITIIKFVKKKRRNK